LSIIGGESQATLGLVREILVRDSQAATEFQILPQWAEFLVYCGYLSRSIQIQNARIVIVLLLPTRELAAAFTSLGVILGSLKSTKEFLTWEQFLELPEGTDLYVKLTYKGANRSLKGVAGEKADSAHGLFRRILITNGPKAIRGSSELVVKESYGRFGISMTEHPKERDLQSIVKAGTFLKGVSQFYKPNWMVSDQVEGLVLTVKTAWRRVTQSIQLGASDYSNSTDLADILLASDRPDKRSSRIAVYAPGKKVESAYAPTAILDGPRALWQWREVAARNFVILAGRSEFDEEMSGTLFDLTSARDDQLLPSEFASLKDKIPDGIGLALFAMPYQ